MVVKFWFWANRYDADRIAAKITSLFASASCGGFSLFCSPHGNAKVIGTAGNDARENIHRYFLALAFTGCGDAFRGQMLPFGEVAMRNADEILDTPEARAE